MILLDTHYWIWLNVDPSRMRESKRKKILGGTSPLAISAISIWEVLVLLQKGRLTSPLEPAEEVRQWLSANPVTVLPIDERTAFLSRSLQFRHEDPADRFIAASALQHACKLATDDENLLSLSWLIYV